MRSSLFLFCIAACLVIVSPLHATPVNIPPGEITPDETFSKKITTLKIKDLQKIAGRKLTIKEKLAFTVVKHKLKKQARRAEEDKGDLSMVFGIGALALLVLALFAPSVLFVSLGAAILAIITGKSTLNKDPSSKKAKTGKLLGWITLGLIAILLLLILIAFSNTSWGWG